MSGWIDHLVIAPIVLPLVVAATMLLFDERRRWLKRALGIVTSLALLAISLLLLQLVNTPAADGGPAKPLVYLLGNWAAPFGIVVIAARLSVPMLALTSVLGFTAMLYALAPWDRSGPRFPALFMFVLMGVHGAFLTADLFHRFVFFELFLASSLGPRLQS